MKNYDFVPKDFYFDVGNGWMHLINKMLEEIKELVDSDPFTYENLMLKAAESEYGKMYISFNMQTDELHKIISKYIKESGKLCENCGKKRGKLRKARAILEILCNDCYGDMLQK